MYSTLHQQRVDSIIKRFEENAFDRFEENAFDVPRSDLPSLYKFHGTSNNTIQFRPYTKDGTNWVSYVWTNTKYAYMRDVRDIIHGLMSNGYTPFYKDVYRDVKCVQSKVQIINNEYTDDSPIKMQTSSPCTHLLAHYKRTKKGIGFCPMYTKTISAADVHHESVDSEVKTQ